MSALGTVTEQDRQQAVRLLKLLGRKATDERVRELATELAFIRETAVSCAVARLEVRERALLPACERCLAIRDASAGRATRCNVHLARPTEATT